MSDLLTEEKEFTENGVVSFSVSNKESVLIKKSIKSLMRMDVLNRKKSLRSSIRKKIHMIKGIITTLRMSFMREDASDVFDFFVMNKNKIREVEAKDISDDEVSFIFYKK